ncbi:hypothetical protein Q3C01_16815 [Bradyrhizobium sp. UFLA05-109]
MIVRTGATIGVTTAKTGATQEGVTLPRRRAAQLPKSSLSEREKLVVRLPHVRAE